MPCVPARVHCVKPPVADLLGLPGEAADQESRLLYVGVTRAPDDLMITHTGDLP
jgi:superfamily I DNA/RNA helicase